MKELKDFISDEKFVAKIGSAFTNLKDDINFDLDTSRETILEMGRLHVDNKQFLSKLITNSKNSSGIIYGERGTGKSHLFLLANEKLNSTISKNKVLSIYINLKNIGFPDNLTKEIFDRIFSIHVYEQIYIQLIRLLKDKTNNSLIDNIKLLFNKNDREFISGITDSLTTIIDFINICYLGNNEFHNINAGTITKEDNIKHLTEVCEKLNMSISDSKLKFDAKFILKMIDESSNKLTKQNTFMSYLNIEHVKKNLIYLANKLKLNKITFYIDEWEKIYADKIIQQYTANFLDKLNGSPIYIWIAYVPYRGSLNPLVVGADLTHSINLDTSLIYEESVYARKRCSNYFKKFVNNRLKEHLAEYEVDYSILFKDDRAFQQLVIASMGNSRDFGLMLIECIDNFLAYRKDALAQGRPFKYINQDMIEDAIKSNGRTKQNNITHLVSVNKVLKDIESFCINRKSSHFAIESNKSNFEILGNNEFSELFYQKLIHLRKTDVPSKEGNVEKRLNIYSIDYSTTYNLHKNEKKITFFLDDKSIHDKVRRYIYKPSDIVDQINIDDGKSFKCKSCSTVLNIEKVKMAWEKNTCPNCWNKLYNT